MAAKLARCARYIGPPLAIVASLGVALVVVSGFALEGGWRYFALASAAILLPEAPTRPKPRGGSYVARHWHGELSLPRSFWLDGAAVFALGLVTSLLAARAVTIHLFREYQGFLVAIALGETFLLIAAYVWALVCIWRAARQYGGSRVWVFLAKLGMIVALLLGALRLIGDLGTLSSV